VLRYHHQNIYVPATINLNILHQITRKPYIWRKHYWISLSSRNYSITPSETKKKPDLTRPHVNVSPLLASVYNTRIPSKCHCQPWQQQQTCNNYRVPFHLLFINHFYLQSLPESSLSLIVKFFAYSKFIINLDYSQSF